METRDYEIGKMTAEDIAGLQITGKVPGPEGSKLIGVVIVTLMPGATEPSAQRCGLYTMGVQGTSSDLIRRIVTQMFNEAAPVMDEPAPASGGN